MTDGSPELVEVRIEGLALDSYRSSSAHHDELFREFALVLTRPPTTGHEVPARLLELMRRVTERFSSFTATPQAELQSALERGDPSVDLVYRVPRDVKEAATELADLLARADKYCEQGALLTVAPPPDAVLFREWFLGEFVNQLDGAPPTTWSDFLERSRSPETN